MFLLLLVVTHHCHEFIYFWSIIFLLPLFRFILIGNWHSWNVHKAFFTSQHIYKIFLSSFSATPSLASISIFSDKVRRSHFFRHYLLTLSHDIIFVCIHRFAPATMTSNGTAKTPCTTRHVPVTYAITNDQPVFALDARSAFEKLTEREQLYAHYLCRASFYGGLIVLVQTSPESPAIYRLIHRINRQNMDQLKAAVVGKDNVTEDDFQAYMVFCSGVYANMGNYKVNAFGKLFLLLLFSIANYFPFFNH